MAGYLNEQEKLLYQALRNGWIFNRTEGELKEKYEWCKQTFGPMYSVWDYQSYFGPEDGVWVLAEIPHNKLKYTIGFKEEKHYNWFILKFGEYIEPED